MFGYFGSKRATEQVISDSGVPFSTLRATQFYDLVLTVTSALAKLPVAPVPSASRFHPVDADEVAERMTALALGEPAGLAPDIGGREAFDFGDLVRGYLRASGRRRLIMPVRLPGNAARAIRSGATLPRDGMFGKRTWEEFLAERLGSTREH